MIVGETASAMLEALEPDPTTVTRDPGRRKPFEWTGNTLYVYALPYTVSQYGSMPGCLRTDFSLRAVYVIDSEGEEARWERHESQDDALEAKAQAYIERLFDPAWRPTGVVVQRVSPNPDFFSGLDENGVALDLIAYHIP